MYMENGKLHVYMTIECIYNITHIHTRIYMHNMYIIYIIHILYIYIYLFCACRDFLRFGNLFVFFQPTLFFHICTLRGEVNP